MKILWEGVLLSDIIDHSQASAEATTIVFHAADGYTTSLPLEFVRSHKILLAYKMNGITIPEERGYPFMVVAEDHWGYKWAKWVTRIELSNDPKYLGYWEQRGYDNSATLPGSNAARCRSCSGYSASSPSATSASPECRATTGGHPAEAASAATIPKASGKMEGTTQASARASR